MVKESPTPLQLLPGPEVGYHPAGYNAEGISYPVATRCVV